MRKSKFTDEKMVSILRETDRDSVAAVAKRHGVSEQTIYGWKVSLRCGTRVSSRSDGGEAYPSGERIAG